METGSDSSGGRRRANTGTKTKEVRLSRGGSRGPSNNTDDDSGDRRISSRPSRQATHQNNAQQNNQSNSNGLNEGGGLGDEPRSRIKRDEQSGEIVEYRHENGESYKVNEASYIQTQRPDVPYLITKITDIKGSFEKVNILKLFSAVSKAGHAEFVTRPFHRVDDLPYHIYQKLHHERQTEFAANDAIQAKLASTSFTRRELFICDAEDAHRELVTTNQIRSHCKVIV